MIFLGVVVLGGVVAVIGLRPAVGDGGSDATPGGAVVDVEAEVGPEVAERAFRRVELFRTGRSGRVLTLTSAEVTALLRHAVPGMLPPGIVEPRVRLQSGRVVVDARLASADFTARAPLTGALGVLPDTLQVRLEGRLVDTRERLTFVVEEARASGMPLPASAVAAVAEALARRSAARVPADDPGAPALSLEWPAGVAFARVDGDRLVLGRDEPIDDRAVDGSDVP